MTSRFYLLRHPPMRPTVGIPAALHFCCDLPRRPAANGSL